MPTVPEIASPTLGQKALGVFVAVQFAVVLIANTAGFIAPIADPSSGEATPLPTTGVGYVRFAADRYLEATGQPQGWGMFESGYMINSVAWDVRIELPDGRVERIQGVAKLPEELHAWNPPATLNRRFVYESSLLGMDLIDTRAGFVEDVRINNAAYLAFFQSLYLRQRLIHADWPPLPACMELAILREPTFDPRPIHDDEIQKVRYVARWRPAVQSDSFLPVEAYDLDAADGPYRQLAKP